MNTFGYVLTLTLSLAMIVKLALSCSQVAHSKLRVSTCWWVVALAGALVATTARVIPGGPFLSIHSDILPVIGCATVLTLGTITFRAISAERRLGLIAAMITALALIGVVIANVLLFWKTPFARGAMFAW